MQEEFYAQWDFTAKAQAPSVVGMTPEGKIREIMKATGWKQQRLAEEFHVSQSTINRWLSGSEPEGHRRDAINSLYDEVIEARHDIETVPLVGYVAAGAAAHFTNGGELGRVEAPKHATKDTVAVEIRGESLGPLFDSMLVYYDEVRSPVTPDMIGRLCVVGLNDDRVLIKKITRSRTPGLFHLLSNTEGPILDVEIAWAAKVRSIEPR
jgi:transcriptional regulator with XRE-family HTH domain